MDNASALIRQFRIYPDQSRIEEVLPLSVAFTRAESCNRRIMRDPQHDGFGFDDVGDAFDRFRADVGHDPGEGEGWQYMGSLNSGGERWHQYRNRDMGGGLGRRYVAVRAETNGTVAGH